MPTTSAAASRACCAGGAGSRSRKSTAPTSRRCRATARSSWPAFSPERARRRRSGVARQHAARAVCSSRQFDFEPARGAHRQRRPARAFDQRDELHDRSRRVVLRGRAVARGMAADAAARTAGAAVARSPARVLRHSVRLSRRPHRRRLLHGRLGAPARAAVGAAAISARGASWCSPSASSAASAQRAAGTAAYPSFAQAAGHALSTIFLDNLAADLERMTQVNRLVDLVPPAQSGRERPARGSRRGAGAGAVDGPGRIGARSSRNGCPAPCARCCARSAARRARAPT